ncbi:hypothetical protein ACW9IO_31925, partial [Pseudomonas azotoformans]
APATKHQKRLLERVAFFVRVNYADCFAAWRGASPLTTASPLATKTFSNLKLRLPEQLFDGYIY